MHRIMKMWRYLFPTKEHKIQEGYDWAKGLVKDDPYSSKIDYIYDSTNSYPLDDFDIGARNYLRDIRTRR